MRLVKTLNVDNTNKCVNLLNIGKEKQRKKVNLTRYESHFKGSIIHRVQNKGPT